MKKLLVILLTVVMVFSCSACVNLGSLFGGDNETVYVQTKEAFYDADGICYKRSVCIYDEFAQLQKKDHYEVEYSSIYDPKLDMYINSYNADSPMELKGTETFAYNENGECIFVEDPQMIGAFLNADIQWTYQDGMPESYQFISYGIEMATEYFRYSDNKVTAIYVDMGILTKDTVIYEYDKEGRLTREFTSSITRQATEKRYSYDGDQLEAVELWEGYGHYDVTSKEWEDEMTLKYRWELDYSRGNLTRMTCYDENGDKSQVRKFSYNWKGYPTKMVCTDYSYEGATSQDTYQDTYTCDKNGNIIKVEHSDGSWEEYTYEKREVTKQQAINYHRRDGAYHKSYHTNSIFINVSWGVWYYHLIPNPLFDLPYYLLLQ